MKSQYKKALRYAFVLDQHNYRDLVHNAYIYHHKKTGGSLFDDQPLPYILRCIKFMWRWEYANVKNKRFYDYDQGLTEFSGNPSYTDGFLTRTSNDLESKEAVEMIYKRVAAYHSGKHNCSLDSKVLVQVMDYLQRGYTGNEIGTMMDISFQTVSNHKKKIQGLIGNLTREMQS